MTATQLKEKRISLDDFIPHLWTISQAPDPGCYEEFYEGLKVFDKDGGGKVRLLSRNIFQPQCQVTKATCTQAVLIDNQISTKLFRSLAPSSVTFWPSLVRSSHKRIVTTLWEAKKTLMVTSSTTSSSRLSCPTRRAPPSKLKKK